MAHPWELTLRQFVERVRQDYGLELDIIPLLQFGLLLTDGARAYSLPGVNEYDLLDLFVLESLCRAFELPRDDFHLDPLPEE